MKWIENLILLSQDHARVDVSDTEDGEYLQKARTFTQWKNQLTHKVLRMENYQIT